jgi:PAS domain S-box-containing protein
MPDERKAKGELLRELKALRSRVAILEQTQRELKKADDASHSLEIQLKDTLDNMPFGVYRTAPDGRILMANLAIVQMLGYSSFEELAGRNLEKEGFAAGYPRSTFKERIEKDGQVVGSESAWIKRDGTTLFIIETARAVRDEHGRTLYYEGVVQDVTELKKSKEALEESEQKFRSIFDNAVDGIVLADIESKKFLIGNKAFSQMLGYNQEEIRNLGVMDIHPKEALPYVTEQFEKQSRREISLARDLPVKRKDGSVFYADVNAFPMTLDGKAHLAGIFRDVTERKQAEDETKLLKRRLEFILGATKTGLDIIDSQFNIRFIDPEWQKIYGDPTGKKCYGYFMGRNKVCPDCGIVKALQTKSVTVSEEVLVKENNRPIQVITIPFQDEKGEWLVAEVNVDITERKKAEEVYRLSEEKFAKAFNSSPAAIFITTLKEGRFIDLNEIAIKVFGYTREEVVGHTAKELNMWANYNDRDIVVQSIRRGNAVRDMESRFRRKSGEVFDSIVSVDIINIGGTECLISTIVDITERKKAEDTLQKSEESVRAILDATAESVLLLDTKGTILAINKTGAQRFGKSVEELVGFNLRDATPGLVSPAVIKSRNEHIDKVIRTGEPVRFEDEREGIIFDSNMFPIFDEKGQVTRLAVFARDITEQRKNEEILRELKNRYQTLFESAPVGIGVASQDNRVLECNNAMLKMMGYSEAEIKQINLRDVYQDPQRRQELLKQLQRDGFVRDFEVQLKRKDGTPYWATLTIIPFTFEGQKVRLTVQEDITDRKKAEDELRESERKFKDLTEATTDWIWEVDKDGVYKYASPKTKEILGYETSEMVGKTPFDFMPEEEAEKIVKYFKEKVLKKEPFYGLENINRHKDGHLVVLETSGVPVLDEKGQLKGYRGIDRNITERKQAQEMLISYREKMIRAEQLASLGALGASLAHEIAQPLTVTTLSLENALTKLNTISCPATVTKKLKDSLAEVSNIASIVKRFRSYVRKSSEGIAEEIKLKMVAERTVRMLSDGARRARVTLRLEGIDKLPPVYSSEKDMEQLFFALVENAIEAADGKKDRQLVISGDVKGEHIELRFSDNCGGIAAENLDKIFEPFFTTKDKGTGLGLCIVEHVVSRTGGKVRVESKAGKGSTFFVTLPLSTGKKL